MRPFKITIKVREKKWSRKFITVNMKGEMYKDHCVINSVESNNCQVDVLFFDKEVKNPFSENSLKSLCGSVNLYDGPEFNIFMVLPIKHYVVIKRYKMVKEYI